MVTLNVSETKSYTRTTLSDVDLIDFTNPVLTPATATFSVLQFDGVQIHTDAAIDGNVGTNGILVRGGSIDASLWDFTNWSITKDLVTLEGSINADVITGSSVRDVINGGAGDDTITGGGASDELSGGKGNDTFVFHEELEVSTFALQETIDGGEGAADKILIAEGTDYLFNAAIVTGIEEIEFANTFNAFATFDATGFVPGGIAVVRGNNGASNGIIVAGSTIDMSAVSFETWLPDEDTISLVAIDGIAATIIGSAEAERFGGSELNDALSGGNGRDYLFGGRGIDTLLGGGGGDLFNFTNNFKVSEIDVGETIDGGSGADTIQLQQTDSAYHLDLATIISVEILNFASSFDSAAVVDGKQIGAAAIAKVISGGGAHSLQVSGAADLSSVRFVSWSKDDLISITGGISSNDTIIGSTEIDTIAGRGGADTIKGGKGGDTLLGGGGGDAIAGEAGRDFLLGESGADDFRFYNPEDSAVGSARDRILDFNQGADSIGLSDMDAITGGGDDAFTFIGQSKFTNGDAGRVRYFITAGGNTVIEGEVNGDATADFQIQLTGSINLAGTDFVL